MKEEKGPWNQVQGKLGEKLALRFLKKRGYQILGTRYRNRYGEIDIIAQRARQISFVEVKSRSNPHFGDPLEHLTKRKISHMRRTALGFLQQNPQFQWEYYYEFLAIAIRPYDKKNPIECRVIFPIE